MGNFALAAMPGKLPLWTLFWNEKSFYFLTTLVLTKLKYNSGIRQCFFSGVSPIWGGTQNSNRISVLSRVFLPVDYFFFFQAVSLVTNT